MLLSNFSGMPEHSKGWGDWLFEEIAKIGKQWTEMEGLDRLKWAEHKLDQQFSLMIESDVLAEILSDQDRRMYFQSFKDRGEKYVQRLIKDKDPFEGCVEALVGYAERWIPEGWHTRGEYGEYMHGAREYLSEHFYYEISADVLSLILYGNGIPPSLRKELSKEPPFLKFSMAQKYKAGPVDPDWLVKNFLECGSLMGLVASGGIGKTWLCLKMGLLLSAAEPESFLGFSIAKPCNVILLTMEDTSDAISRRLNELDPDGSLRSNSGDYFTVLTAAEFNGNFTFGQKTSSGNLQPTNSYNKLLEFLSELKAKYPDRPLVLIIDTYSATFHGDENTAGAASEWFKMVSLLKSQLNVTVLVTHHIRKTSHAEPVRTPDDFLSAIRGSNVFVNSCRTVFGIWPVRDTERKAIPGIPGSQDLFNFCVVKDNNHRDWSSQNVNSFKQPTITLTRTQKGYLDFDPAINLARKVMWQSKSEGSEQQQRQLQEELFKLLSFYADAGHPLSLSTFNKTEGYQRLLSETYRKLAPKIIKTGIDTLILEGRIAIAKIKINNRLCEAYDRSDGPFALGKEVSRTLIDPPLSPFNTK